MVGADKADQEADEPAVGSLGNPRGSREVLKPQSRQQRVHHPATPPLIHDRYDLPVIGLGWVAQAHVRAWHATVGRHETAPSAETSARSATCAATRSGSAVGSSQA